jgi:hypothetical protein
MICGDRGRYAQAENLLSQCERFLLSRDAATRIVSDMEQPCGKGGTRWPAERAYARRTVSASPARLCTRAFGCPSSRMCEPASLVAGKQVTRIRLASRLVGRNANSSAMGSRGALRDSRGTLPCPAVLFCARRSQRPSSTQFSINSSPTESGSYKTGSQPRFALTPPGRPYKANVGGSIPSAPTKQITHLLTFFLMQSAAARHCGTLACGWLHPASSAAPPRCSPW